MDISTCSPAALAGIKIVLTDVDGTLLDSNHNMPEENAKAFGDYAAAGIIAAVASGRSQASTLSCLTPALQSTMRYNGCPGVFLNGGVVIGKNGEILSCSEISVNAQRKLLDAMKDENILKNILGYTRDRICCIEKNAFTTKSCVVYKEPEPEVITYEQFITTRFVKLVACGTVESTDKIRPVLQNAVGSDLRCVRPLDWNLEFINPSTSKAIGAKMLLTNLNLTPRNMLSIGDGENDTCLLKLAGVSVAVANACPQAKEAASYTTVTNDDCAFSVVAKHVLNARRTNSRNPASP